MKSNERKKVLNLCYNSEAPTCGQPAGPANPQATRYED